MAAYDPVKVSNRTDVSAILLGVVAWVFFFIAGSRPELLRENLAMTIQLVMVMPVLLTHLFLLSKSLDVECGEELAQYSKTLFSIGYAMLVNSMGILIAALTSVHIALLFFLVNVLSVLGYSMILIRFERSSFRQRMARDWPFLAILLFFGVLVVL